MLDELIKNYPGVKEIVQVDGENCKAVIAFNSAD